MEIERRYVGQYHEIGPLLCEHKKRKQACRNIAEVFIRAGKIAGYFCETHAEEIIRRLKEREKSG